MLKRLKKKWLRLWDAPPGKRFQNYYKRSRRDKNRNEATPRIARLILAVALFVIGVCLIFFPLVYIPFFLVSAAMFASESLKFAQLLDRCEVWVRITWARTKRKYGISSRTVHVLSVTAGAAGLLLSGYFCYNAFIR
jgi:hypothetical protein